MKPITLLLIVAIASLLIISESKKKGQHKKHHQINNSQDANQGEGKNISNNKIATPVDTKPVHVQEMMLGNLNNMMKDRHPLWRNNRNNNLERPFLHGVVGPQWEVPVAEDDRGFNHIASPMPKPQSNRRILPSEFPPVTYSRSTFDMPLKRDVIQADIPPTVIRTTEENFDPRFPAMKPVAKVTGTLYHGTGSNDEKIVHGLNSFLQKKSKKAHRFHHIDAKDLAMNNKTEGRLQAQAAEAHATNMLYSITNNPVENPHMILDVNVVNKYEQPDLRLNENNKALKLNRSKMRNTIAGVRDAHSLRKLPLDE